MFFAISSNAHSNYPCHWPMGALTLSTDQGWQEIRDGRYHVVYKGYMDDAPLAQTIRIIASGEACRFTGNFCAVVMDTVSQNVTIRSDKYRGFPIYVHEDQITNLQVHKNVVWTDSTITITPDFTVELHREDVIGHIDTKPLSMDAAISAIHEILLAKTQKFLGHNQLPIKVYLSGGVDSLLVYAYLQYCTQQYEMVRCAHIDYDWFWMWNSGDLKKHWGYQQIHHWLTPCVLTSGAPGDEFMLRSPATVNKWLRYHGMCMQDLLRSTQWQNCLHAAYYSKPGNKDIFQMEIDHFDNRDQMLWQLCNININDWQHWHIGHTLTWTPLRDLDIFKILLRLPVEHTLGQIMDSQISRRLIEMVAPGMTRLISDQKNTGNLMRNLAGYYFP